MAMEMDELFENPVVETMAKVDASTGSLPRTRLDPRTGKQMLLQPASFWLDHAERRKASGQSNREYCEEHGLALSTFRRWSARSAAGKRVKKSGRLEGLTAPSPAAAFLSVPIRAPSGCEGAGGVPTAQIEVQTRSGMRVCLYGQAADRAIDAVMAELSASR